MRAKGAVLAKAPLKLRLLGAKALTRRKGMGVEWGRYAGSCGGLRLEGHSDCVLSLAPCAGRMCSGSTDGSIRVWNIATLVEERVIETDGDDAIYTLTVREGEVTSWHFSGRIRMWDVGSGLRLRELQGHDLSVNTLLVGGSRLARG